MSGHDWWHCERSDCTDPSHDGENWCGPCGGWIDGEPCDEPEDEDR